MAGEISIYGVFFPLIQVQGLIALIVFFSCPKNHGEDRTISMGLAPGVI